MDTLHIKQYTTSPCTCGHYHYTLNNIQLHHVLVGHYTTHQTIYNFTTCHHVLVDTTLHNIQLHHLWTLHTLNNIQLHQVWYTTRHVEQYTTSPCTCGHTLHYTSNNIQLYQVLVDTTLPIEQYTTSPSTCGHYTNTLNNIQLHHYTCGHYTTHWTIYNFTIYLWTLQYTSNNIQLHQVLVGTTLNIEQYTTSPCTCGHTLHYTSNNIQLHHVLVDTTTHIEQYTTSPSTCGHYTKHRTIYNFTMYLWKLHYTLNNIQLHHYTCGQYPTHRTVYNFTMYVWTHTTLHIEQYTTSPLYLWTLHYILNNIQLHHYTCGHYTTHRIIYKFTMFLWTHTTLHIKQYTTSPSTCGHYTTHWTIYNFTIISLLLSFIYYVITYIMETADIGCDRSQEPSPPREHSRSRSRSRSRSKERFPHARFPLDRKSPGNCYNFGRSGHIARLYRVRQMTSWNKK